MGEDQKRQRPKKYYTSIRQSRKDRTRKWHAPTGNTPKTQNDADDNTEATEDGKRIDVGEYRRRENTINEILGKKMKGKYLTKWTSPDGAARRQIDYIATNAKCMDAERTAKRNT